MGSWEFNQLLWRHTKETSLWMCRFTFLHAPREMKSKNVEALKMLLALCQDEPEALKDTWNAVLECLSRLEYLTSTLASSNILMLGGNQISRHSLLLSLTELAGNPTEQVFVNSAKLPSDAVVEFCTALCGVSRDELQQNPPRLFSLTKLIEISYYNLLRIRMVRFLCEWLEFCLSIKMTISFRKCLEMRMLVVATMGKKAWLSVTALISGLGKHLGCLVTPFCYSRLSVGWRDCCIRDKRFATADYQVPWEARTSQFHIPRKDSETICSHDGYE